MWFRGSEYIQISWSMFFHPAKVSLKELAISFEILSTHCVYVAQFIIKNCSFDCSGNPDSFLLLPQLQNVNTYLLYI